ncbi:MAG: DUF3842 family protein [Rectinemataceae bacterium]|jgi:hypothetical protein
MIIAIVDGMGGGIGAQLVERIKRENLQGSNLIALGTNAVATQRMIEAGADRGASGENAIRVSIAIADFIVGPIGIVLANAMMGEISPAIAEAILSARGKKLLLPLVQSHVVFVGLAQKNLGELIAEAVESLVKASKAGD